MTTRRARRRRGARPRGAAAAVAAALVAVAALGAPRPLAAEDAPPTPPPPAKPDPRPDPTPDPRPAPAPDARPDPKLIAPRDDGPSRVTRRDLALALRAFEYAWRDAPPTDAETRRAVAALVSRATMAFFLGAGANAVDGLNEATWRVVDTQSPFQRPWTAGYAALARTRVRLPAVSVLPDEPWTRMRFVEARLVAMAPLPQPWPVVRATGFWTLPPRCGGNNRGCGTVAEALVWDGRPATLSSRALNPGSSERCEGLRALTVILTEGEEPFGVGVWGETCVVHGDPSPRIAAAKARLAAVPAAVAAPPGLRPTLARFATRMERALRDEVDEVLVDVPDELRRLEEGVAALEAAARAGTAVRLDRAALAGDHHRVTAAGRPYRVWVPPAAPDRPPGPLPLVIALHGMGGTEDMFFEAYGAGEALRQAQTRGVVLAAPDDVDTAAEVVDDLRTLLPIDPDRVYGVGHSMGAGALLRAAVRQPDLFAALAPIAGGWMSVTSPTWSVLTATPVLAVTAEQDFGRAITERTARAAKAAGVPVDLRVLADLDHLLVVGEALPGIFAFFDGKARPRPPR